jgi:dTDP-4-dehydrorhamnose reductase
VTILVFGKTGQVARSLAALEARAPAPLRFLGREEADLTEPARCASAIEACKPLAVINAAAWTAVDAAEAAEAEATVVNGEAPGAMARACARVGIPFLHISSDYVFDGSGAAPQAPESPVAPLGAYGRSKALGEGLVQASGARALILRTSWVFSSFGANFVKTMLRLGAERERLGVVDDQVGGPTSADAIACALLTLTDALLTGHPGGLYHFAGAPAVSWAGFASEIMKEAGLSCVIDPIPSEAYPTPAPRPRNSRLACEALLSDFGIPQPDWQADLAQVLHKLAEES